MTDLVLMARFGASQLGSSPLIQQKEIVERDVINGFDRGSGLIDLSAMDANLFFQGDAAFSFIGTAQFAGTGIASAGELRLQSVDGPNAVIVEADLRGDGVADFQLFVNLTTVLSADDFIL